MPVEPEELNEAELFNQAVSDDRVETTETPITETERPETTETETVAATETPPERAAVDDNAPLVPSWRLREINEEKRSLAEKLANLEAERAQWQRTQQQAKPEAAKPQAPDPLLDPDGYKVAVKEEIRQEILNERREESLQAAAEADPENFKAAYALAQQRVDPALKARMQESRNPGKTLLTWYREQKIMQEVGNDPNAWLESKLAERLKDPAFLAKAVEAAQNSARQTPQQTNGRSRVELPPSLSSASRSNAAARTDNTDVSDAELFRETTG